jgi:hypothetical protein
VIQGVEFKFGIPVVFSSLLLAPGNASRQEVLADLPRNVDGSPHDAPAMASQQAGPAGHTALAFAAARSKS